MRKVFQDSDRFENQILRFICLIGILRMLVEFYSNYLRDTPVFGWVMDISITGLLIVFVVLTFTKINIKWLTYTFSIAAIAFIGISWVNQGGVYGRSEYNYFALIIIMGIIHSGRSLIVFLAGSLALLISLVLLWEYDFSIFEPFILTFSEWPLHYIGVVLLTTLFIGFLRMKNDLEVKQIDEHNIQLSKRALQMDIENSNLLLQQKEYEKVNDELELEIAKRKQALDRQNKSLHEFINLTLKELYPPLQSTLNTIKNVKNEEGENKNINMLSKSGYNLEKAYEGMKIKLKKNTE